jgi:hypothetical protein
VEERKEGRRCAPDVARAEGNEQVSTSYGHGASGPRAARLRPPAGAARCDCGSAHAVGLRQVVKGRGVLTASVALLVVLLPRADPAEPAQVGGARDAAGRKRRRKGEGELADAGAFPPRILRNTLYGAAL